MTIRVTRSSLTVCSVPTVTVTPGNSGPAGSPTDLTTPKTMRNVGSHHGQLQRLTCEWVIASGTTQLGARGPVDPHGHGDGERRPPSPAPSP